MTSRITGTGSCLAKACVTNDWLSGIMDTSDEWIRTRTGIRERHLVKEETTTDMAYEASVRALEQAGLSPKELDLIVVGTVTADHVTPSAACELQARLEADRAMAFDINAACSGFLFAIQTADAFLQAGRFKNALVIGAESLSRIMDWSDRSTCVLFGDGAGAAVMQPSETGILGYDQGCDGKKGSALLCVNRKNHNPLTEEEQIVDYVGESVVRRGNCGLIIFRKQVLDVLRIRDIPFLVERGTELPAIGIIISVVRGIQRAAHGSDG